MPYPLITKVASKGSLHNGRGPSKQIAPGQKEQNRFCSRSGRRPIASSSKIRHSALSQADTVPVAKSHYPLKGQRTFAARA